MKRHHANWLEAYYKYTQYSEAPDLFHFWTGVSTIAGALRRQVWIDQRFFHWTPNFYIVLVGPPGVAAKSTSLRLGTSLLRQIDGINFGPRSMTWQALTHALEEAATLVPMGKDGDKLPMACISCAINELGTFLRPEDKTMVDVLVDLWDGQLESWDRRTVYKEGQVSIINPWINVMGCTTPSWLRDNMPEAMIGGGLVSRIVFVYGDTKRRLVAYPAKIYNKENFLQQGEHLVEDLRKISQLKGEYLLTPEAEEWGTDWYNKHWETRPKHMISNRYGGYIARKQGHVHKLAMILADAQRDELIITKSDLMIAVQMMTGMETSMQTVFQSIGVGDISRLVMEILSYVRAYRQISGEELWRHMLPIMGPKEFTEASDAAVKAGYLRIKNIGGVLTYCATKTKEYAK